MYVVATAGHVDHGKSTLVRALTGTDPDRLAEEKRRGLTIELGYAWTTLPGTDEPLALVDVPGHERFIATMLAGLGPVAAVLFVVAADEGWREQSAEHLAVVDALGLTHGLLAVTRADLADPTPALREARRQIARTSLGEVEAVTCSGRTGEGLDSLRSALAGLARGLPVPRADGPVRLWVDRSFSIRGAGTVVTGTLDAGTVTVGDVLQVGDRTVRVRGLQSLEQERTTVVAAARVAVNLRGIERHEVPRGSALCTPGPWRTGSVDVLLDRPVEEATGALQLHLGTTAVPVRLRRLGERTARLRWEPLLPVRTGDRLVLRDPGRHLVVAGARVLDADPPPLGRRGAARERDAVLTGLVGADAATILGEQVRRRGAVRRDELVVRGVEVRAVGEVLVQGDWLVDPPTWKNWQDQLRSLLQQRSVEDPLDPRLPRPEVARRLGAPLELVDAVAAAVGLRVREGRVEGGTSTDLGTAEAGLAALEARLQVSPFAAPERGDLEGWALGSRELAAAARLGRIVRLNADVVLLPTGPARAMRVLAGLPQPFTTSQARQALGSTRRVVIPLLEHLDRRGWTRRLDGDHREVRR